MMPTLIVFDGHMMDHLIELTDEQLLTLHVDPACEYLGLSAQEWDVLAQATTALCLTPIVRVGGAGANTARGFARLGGRAVVHGQVGDDEAGRCVIAQLRSDRCSVQLRTVSGATGRCLVFVRPDGKRVMRSDVGVVLDFDDADSIVLTMVPRPRILHLTGYLLNPVHPIHHAVRAVMDVATGEHVAISIDIGSAAYLGDKVVREIVENYATVMFLNEDEARQLGLGSPEMAAAELLRWATVHKRDAIVVVTRGSQGVLACRRDEVVNVPARRVIVRDTTGAGDAFAAGFLFALMQGRPLEACARLGCHLAAKTVQVIGGVPDE
ncbi:MAG: adenosine kinase [Patescibacteria group bacterium]